MKGETLNPMEDYVVAETKDIGSHEVGLFALYDGFEIDQRNS